MKEEFESHFGIQSTGIAPLIFASEDVSHLGTDIGAPLVFWGLGSADPEAWGEARTTDSLEKLPQLHTSTFTPAVKPTMKTGVEAISVAALGYLTTKWQAAM